MSTIHSETSRTASPSPSTSSQATPSGAPTVVSAKRSSGQRRSKGHVPTIPTATAQLLTSTKALLQSLTAWANKSSTVSEVSERFVRVGDDFKSLRKSYVAAGLEVSDIEDVPRLLRGVLEESLVLEPSQKSLDAFLPRVGKIITDLMKILKVKQAEMQRLSEARKSSATLDTFPGDSTPVSDRSTSPVARTSIGAGLTATVPLVAKDSLNLFSPPSPKDPIARLQNNHALMRRASKRFSAYQTSKILSMNHSTTSSPVPTTATTTIVSSPPAIKIGVDESNDSTPETPSGKPKAFLELPSSPLLQEEVSKNIKESELDKRLSSAVTDNGYPSILLTPTLKRSKDRIYLKIGNKVKKVDLSLPTTVANIKVLFTQKFGYSPSGMTYPAIYIQESPTDMAYEMEDINDIQSGCICSLQQPDLATVICEHLDNKFDLLRDDVSKIQDFAIKQSKKDEIGNAADERAGSGRRKSIDRDTLMTFKKEINELKFELGKARQQQSKSKNQLTTNLNDLLTLVQKLQTISMSPDGVISNPYMDHCKSKVSSECESLVSRIDNLQDLIEVLKVDISKRRSRPSQKQLTHIQKELGSTKSNLASLTNYIVSERKNWNNRWQSELTAILEEQEFFKEQETIVQLLDEDLISADETFDLIVKCCDELSKNANARKGPKLPFVDPSVSLQDVKSMVLQEVQNLNPDHDQRVEAIMKAEKVREMERKMLNKTAFEQELGDFVGSSKLKNSGGVDEVERMRRLKDEENLKSQFKV